MGMPPPASLARAFMRKDEIWKESILTAEAAMGVMKAFGLTATPAHYEVLYLGMSGANPTPRKSWNAN